jgi:hypothetical protein
MYWVCAINESSVGRNVLSVLALTMGVEELRWTDRRVREIMDVRDSLKMQGTQSDRSCGLLCFFSYCYPSPYRYLFTTGYTHWRKSGASVCISSGTDRWVTANFGGK